MNNNFDFLDNLQNSLFQKEINFPNFESLNRFAVKHKENILCLNIRSLNANFTNLEVFIERLDFKPVIIICTETWELTHPNLYSLKNYKLYYNNSNINKSDGTVVYISDKLIEETKVISCKTLKIINTSIKLETNENLEISALYRSHDLGKPEFIESLKNYLKLKNKIKNHLIIGDFNINLLQLDHYTSEHLNNLQEFGFYPGFTGITRPADSESEGSCIDNVFIKTNSISTTTFKLSVPLTDHLPIFISCCKLKKLNKSTQYTTTNSVQLINTANNVYWNEILSMQDPDLATDELINKIQFCIEQAKTVKNLTKDKNRPRKEWITKGIIESCKRKDFLYKIYKKNPNNSATKKEFQLYSKILNRVISEAKYRYEYEEVQTNLHSTKKLWNLINEKIGKVKNKEQNINYILDENELKINNSKEIASKFNYYFSNIGIELSAKIDQPPNTTIDLPPSNHKTFFLFPTNNFEIQQIITKMKLKKGGVDGITTKTLKLLKEFITPSLVHIINLSIVKSVWPKSLKIAEIKPIHKSKSKHHISNYRPISLISNIAKIFEKIVHCRLFKFCIDCNLISDNQYGFVKKRNSNQALNKVTNIILDRLDNGKPIAITFLDLAKAFDTVNHKILLDKLYNYGIRGCAHKFITSYLQERKQRVIINNEVSESCDVSTGVPQGSILGPLLFILYINDLLKKVPENILMSYADDTVVISIDNTWPEVEQKMNELLVTVSTWLALNKLSLNVEKTIYMAFGNHCDCIANNLDIRIKNIPIIKVESAKYLGVIFDQRLKWDKHIEYVMNKTKYLIVVFYKLSKYMKRETLLLIYYALFNSIISYGIISWGGAYNNYLQLLQSRQNKILKIINKNTFVSIKNPLVIRQLFALESIIFYYLELRNRFINSTSKTRRKLLPPPKTRNKVSDKSSYLVAIYYYNELPNNLKQLQCSYKTLKRTLKEWIVRNV